MTDWKPEKNISSPWDDEEYGIGEVSHLNDTGYTFSQIADLIQAQL